MAVRFGGTDFVAGSERRRNPRRSGGMCLALNAGHEISPLAYADSAGVGRVFFVGR